MEAVVCAAPWERHLIVRGLLYAQPDAAESLLRAKNYTELTGRGFDAIFDTGSQYTYFKPHFFRRSEHDRLIRGARSFTIRKGLVGEPFFVFFHEVLLHFPVNEAVQAGAGGIVVRHLIGVVPDASFNPDALTTEPDWSRHLGQDPLDSLRSAWSSFKAQVVPKIGPETFPNILGRDLIAKARTVIEPATTPMIKATITFSKPLLMAALPARLG